MKLGVIIGIVLAASLTNAPVRADDRPKDSTAPSKPAVALVAVDPSDGIGASEARAIANEYFQQEYGDCGGTQRVRRSGRTWVFSLLFGAAGEKLKDTIKVDAKTGGVWSEGGPRYRTFKAFLEKTNAAHDERHP
jgi:hypothetical protein